MCKIYNQERRIWKRLRLTLANKCGNEVAITTVANESDCSCAETCKKVNEELKTWLNEKHKKRGKN